MDVQAVGMLYRLFPVAVGVDADHRPENFEGRNKGVIWGIEQYGWLAAGFFAVQTTGAIFTH